MKQSSHNTANLSHQLIKTSGNDCFRQTDKYSALRKQTIFLTKSLLLVPRHKMLAKYCLIVCVVSIVCHYVLKHLECYANFANCLCHWLLDVKVIGCVIPKSQEEQEHAHERHPAMWMWIITYYNDSEIPAPHNRNNNYYQNTYSRKEAQREIDISAKHRRSSSKAQRISQ